MADASLYDTDVVAWAEQQVEELRRLAERTPTNAVDWTNVIEEIECVGRSERHSVETLIINALAHLLKIAGDPDSLAVRGWEKEVAGFLRQASQRATGAIRNRLDLAGLWADALSGARQEIRLYGRSLPPHVPAECPFRLADILDRHPDIGRLLATIGSDRRR